LLIAADPMENKKLCPRPEDDYAPANSFALPMALAPSPQGGGVCRFLPFHVQRTIYLHSALSDLIPQSVENVMYQSDIHRL
jgi:hypothetical protein